MTLRRFSPSPSTVAPVLFALFAGLFWLRWWSYYQFTIDDTYISLVYSKNFLAGNGITFNGLVVEGYSNFLWVMLTALLGAIGVDLLLAAKLLGLLSVLLLFAVSFRVYRLVLPGSGYWLTWLFMTASLPLIVWSVSGLETLFFSLLILVSLYTFLLGQKRDDLRYYVASALTLIGLTLTRPEGFLFIGVFLATAVIFDIWHMRRIQFKPYLLVAFIWTLGTGAFFLWRWQYYGYLWPATVYAKTGDLPSQIQEGIQYMVSFWQYAWLSLLVFGLTFPFLLVYAWRRQEMVRAVAMLTAAFLGYAAFVVMAGGDWMPMFRFLAPVLPIFYLLLALSLTVLWQSECGIMRVGSGLLASVIALSLLQIPQTMRRHVTLVIETASGLPTTGRWLSHHASPEATIAVIDAGALPYYSELATLDMVGLNDYYIATLPAPWIFKYDNDYVLAQEPDYIQMHLTPSLNGKGVLPTDFMGTLQLYHMVEFHRWYEFMPDIPGTFVFQRRETPANTTPMDNYAGVRYGTTADQLTTAPGETVSISLTVTNEGTAVWPAGGGQGWGVVKLIYRLYPAEEPARTLHEQRVALPEDLAPGETTTLNWQFTAPTTPGLYHLELDMLSEVVMRFSEKGAPKPTIQLVVQ
jgi:arabinofuranosyltransferase